MPTDHADPGLADRHLAGSHRAGADLAAIVSDTTVVPARDREPIPYRRRRRLMAGLVGATLLAATGVLGYVLLGDGFDWADAPLLLLFLASGICPVIGAWNAIIGFLLLRRHGDEPAATVWPGLRQVASDAPLRGRTAVVMPIYDEDPDGVFANLAAVARSLVGTGQSEMFALHLLSDSRSATVIAEEEQRVAEWNAVPPAGLPLIYRRRAENTGFKAGNIAEFCNGAVGIYDYMLVLDADSAMDGAAIGRLVRILDSDPGLGIIQTLAVGSPAENAFTRLFQFGMRQGMRTYTMGSAWWQGPDGPYWGHNALIRLRPFAEQCRLPRLPGAPPLGGHLLSHDQIEAVMMRRAGYDVRVLVAEGGSYEENPPHLLDFIRRDLRWCQGNMQYLGLMPRLGRSDAVAPIPGIRPMGLVQLALAILMYLSSAAWMGFMAVGLLSAAAASVTVDAGDLAASREMLAERAPIGIGVFIVMIAMALLPKLLGVADILCWPAARRAYGGTGRVIGGAGLELVVSALISPTLAIAQCLFIGRLLTGRGLTWAVQNRNACGLSLAGAAWRLWPQTLIGFGIFTVLWVTAPGLLGWAAPMVLGLVTIVPIAMITAASGPSRWMRRNRVCAIPEEFDLPPVLADRNRLRAKPTDPNPSRGTPGALPVFAPACGDD